MHPILFKLGPVPLPSYGFFMAVGVIFALWFVYRQGQKQGLDAPKLLDAAFYILLVSLLGAKLVLLAGSFSYYIQNPKELFPLAKSGGVFQGGLVFGIVFALWYLRRKRIPTWKTADIAAPALALGHGFGRIGCFMAGCCYGKECALPWGVTFHDEGAHNLIGIPLNESLHPVQLYESALNFLNFFILFVLLRKKKFDGQVFPMYIINYSIIRYFTEFFRGDHSPKAILLQGSSALSTVTYPQFFCLLGLIAGVALYVIFKKRQSA